MVILLNLCCDFNITSQLNKQFLELSNIISGFITVFFVPLEFLTSLLSSIKYEYVFA